MSDFYLMSDFFNSFKQVFLHFFLLWKDFLGMYVPDMLKIFVFRDVAFEIISNKKHSFFEKRTNGFNWK